MEPTIVCDFGSYFVKFGIAGEPYPRYIIPTRQSPTLGIDFRQINEDDLQALILSVLKRMQKLLMIKNGKNRSILICEDIMLPLPFKKILHSCLFKSFEFESIVWMPNSILAMIAVGLNRGLVVDMGCELTSVIPVFDGYSIYESYSCIFRPKSSLSDDSDEEKTIEMLIRSSDKLSKNEYLANLFIEDDRCVILDSLLLAPIIIRKDLASQIILCGGNALISDISSYVMSMILKQLELPRYESLQGLKSVISIKETAMPANVLNWIGGSLFASTKMQAQIELKRKHYINGDISLNDWAMVNMN